MKNLKILFLSILCLIAFSANAKAEYFSDIIVTSPNAIWTDSRAYSTLNAAITAVGANQRTVVISSSQAVTNLTVPANVTLKFERDGAIANSGQLTINTKSIIADDHQIFTGAGDVDFASGTVIRLSWFSNLLTALTLTSDDTITLIMNKSITALSSYAVGNNVILRWEAPGNILTSDTGVTISNIGQVEGGNYQLFAGAGNFRFRDGTELNLSWFIYLRAALTWIDTNKVTLVVNKSSAVDYSDSIPSTINVRIKKGGDLAISGGITLTIANARQIDIGPYYFDPFTGIGSVAITGGSTYTPATTLTALVLRGLSSTFIPYEVDALYDYGSGLSFTRATLVAACTAVGSDAATILARSGTWTIGSDMNLTAVCPNAVIKPALGAVFTHTTFTMSIPNPDALPSQNWINGTGAVTFSGGVGTVYATWFGATTVGTSAPIATANVLAINKSIVATSQGGNWVLPDTGGRYAINGTITFNGFIGARFTMYGARDDRRTALLWVGTVAATDAIVIDGCSGTEFVRLSVDSDGAAAPARYGIHLQSDNTPAIINNTFIQPTVLKSATAGIAITGKTTDLEQNDGNTFINPWLEDNKYNFYQTTGNSQGTVLINPRMGCTTLTYAGAETEYNIYMSGGGLYIYNAIFGTAKYSDIWLGDVGDSHIHGGLHVFGAYTETKNAFLDMDNAYQTVNSPAGGIELYGVFNPSDAAFAEQTDVVHLEAGGSVIMQNCDFAFGDIRIGDTVGQVILTNVVLKDGDVIEEGIQGNLIRTGGSQTTSVGSVGKFVTPAFDAANFQASGSMTWTVEAGDVTSYQWSLAGKIMTVNFNIETSTVGGTPSTYLRIKIPGTKTAAKTLSTSAYCNDNGTGSIGVAMAVVNETEIRVYKTPGANWAAATNTTGVSGQITFEVK